jgi:hypothetical protein
VKRLGDLLHTEPNPEQAEATQHVLDVALAWQLGQHSLDAVHDLTTGFERWQAMRFADQASAGYAALQSLVDQLVAIDRSVLRTAHGLVNADERFRDDVRSLTNWAGKRVLLWPLCYIAGEPQYSPVHLPPSEDRREIERAIQGRYELYRSAKRGVQAA